MKACLFCALLLALFPGGSWAAVEGEVGLEGTWTENLYLTASSLEDFVAMPFGHVRADLGEDFGMLYRLNGYLYYDNSELNALWQRASALYQAQVGEAHELEAEIGYGGTLHVSDTNNLDHHRVGGRLDLNWRPLKKTLIIPGIQGYWGTYPDLDGLDYVESIGNLIANKSFRTKTTLRLGGTLYFRRYLESVPEEPAAGTPGGQGDSGILLAAAAAGPGDSPGPGGGGGGPGSGPGQPGGSGRGRVRWQGSEEEPPPGTTITGNRSSQSAGQILFAARAAQALGSRAGIFAEGTYRTNFLDPPRFAEGTIPGLDRDFLDDHYGYEGPGGLVQFSLLLPRSVRMVARGLIEERRYVGREALDLQGAPKDPAGEERRDERYELEVRGEFSRSFEWAFPTGVSADLGYVHLWNRSNDDWYDTEEDRIFASVSLAW